MKRTTRLTTARAILYVFGLFISGFAAIQSQTSTPTTPPLPSCTASEARAAREMLPAYIPGETAPFVQLRNGRFVIDSQSLIVRGANYYPMNFPWRRFLTASVLQELERELMLLRETGFNTLRLFLWNEALFTCPARGAVPNAEAFARLDGLIRMAADDGFHLIVTLNDLPDLTDYPLYDGPAFNRAQTVFIVERYREEPAILAWDLRNEGDIDYGSNNLANLRFPREVVLNWLAETSAQVRELDPNHLITAGWLFDAEATAPYVDFISFHHWGEAAELERRIQTMRAATDKPILLEEFGFSTFNRSEAEQARLLGENVQVAEAEGLLGWLVWTAFDFPREATCIPPACPSVDNAEHHFGLWRTDYTAKPAVGVITQRIGEGS